MPTPLSEFMEEVRAINNDCEDVLNVANDEYAQDHSKFNNFDITAMIMSEVCPDLKGKIKPQHIVMIFQLKHLFSIWGGVSRRESMRGRYIDAINYLHLHRGVMDERAKEAEEEQNRESVVTHTRELLNSLANTGALTNVPPELEQEFWRVKETLNGLESSGG